MSEITTYAAIDLGSNSFHMIIAREEADGHLMILDRLRETVRLAGGLTAEGDIDTDTEALALDTLAKFGQRLREFSSDRVRCVGTNTLRRIHPKANFLKKAEAALGHPIDIIAGREEARLIYLGTTYSTAPVDGKQLVVDIGGGSTELIIGAEGKPQALESINIGCVTYTSRYFKDGAITEEAYNRAITQARLQLRPIASHYRNQGWVNALGCSGTIKAVEVIAQANDWCESGISKSALKKLRKALIAAGHIDKIELKTLKDNRQAVIIGGVAVLEAIFKALKLEHMDVSQSSLREGLLYDLIGRSHKEDIREQTVQALRQQYLIDNTQAERVQGTALALFEQVKNHWDLSDEQAQTLGWAAQLCEVGLALSHSKYHRHSEYILGNADLPGFSWHEQAMLAALARLHRSNFNLTALETVPSELQDTVKKLAVILRLAVLLNRSRQDEPLPEIRLHPEKHALSIAIDEDWLLEHPLTSADLQAELQASLNPDWPITLQFEHPSSSLLDLLSRLAP